MLHQRALTFPLSEWRVSCRNSCGIKKFWVTQTWIQICALLLLSWVTLGNLLSLNHNFLVYVIRDSNHLAGLLWSINWIIYLKTHSTGSVNISAPHLHVLVICVNLWFLIVCTCPKIWHCIYLCILPVPMPRVLKRQQADMTLVDESHQVMDYLESLFSWL